MYFLCHPTKTKTLCQRRKIPKEQFLPSQNLHSPESMEINPVISITRIGITCSFYFLRKFNFCKVLNIVFNFNSFNLQNNPKRETVSIIIILLIQREHRETGIQRCEGNCSRWHRWSNFRIHVNRHPLSHTMDREAWRAAIHGVAKSRTRLSSWTELNWTECMNAKMMMQEYSRHN